MVILFENIDKKEKSKLIKGLENINQILKNIFNEVFINNKGVCYNNESTLLSGRCFCETNFNNFIEIKENQLFKLNTRVLYECLKAGKTKILGYTIVDSKYIFNTEIGDFTIGEFIDEEVLNMDKLKSILNNTTCSFNRNDLLERFSNKEFIDVDAGEYKMFITHKLFPSINKSKKLDIKIHDNNDGTFYSSFISKIEERNKKDEVTFDMNIYYMYKFIHL